jgi:hypothetical protein
MLAVVALACLAVPAHARSPFVPAHRGCAIAHCDPEMSDLVGMSAPRSIGSTWFDSKAASASQGLGCTSNGKTAVCTFGDRSGDRKRPYMKAYNAAGKALWSSGRALDSWAWTSVPMVDESGGVVAADDVALVRFAPSGRVLWKTRTAGGAPISPTRTANGTIVLATSGGPISAYDPASGRRLATLDVRETLTGLPGRFDTRNTAAARGNRIYVSTEFKPDNGSADPNHHARLYAIDVDPTQPPASRLRIAWFYEFGARSGASPLVVGDLVIFDGDRAAPSSPFGPRFFALRDEGATSSVVWESELGGPGVASAARDPRGGAWVFAFGQPTLRRLSTSSGATLQSIDLDALVGEPGVHTPYSAMSIANGPAGHPVMLVSARAGQSSVYLVAVDLVSAVALWKHKLPGAAVEDTPMGQFPIASGRKGRRAVVFSTKKGIRAVAGPRPAD